MMAQLDKIIHRVVAILIMLHGISYANQTIASLARGATYSDITLLEVVTGDVTMLILAIPVFLYFAVSLWLWRRSETLIETSLDINSSNLEHALLVCIKTLGLYFLIIGLSDFVSIFLMSGLTGGPGNETSLYYVRQSLVYSSLETILGLLLILKTKWIIKIVGSS